MNQFLIGCNSNALSLFFIFSQEEHAQLLQQNRERQMEVSFVVKILFKSLKLFDTSLYIMNYRNATQNGRYGGIAA